MKNSFLLCSLSIVSQLYRRSVLPSPRLAEFRGTFSSCWAWARSAINVHFLRYLCILSLGNFWHLQILWRAFCVGKLWSLHPSCIWGNRSIGVFFSVLILRKLDPNQWASQARARLHFESNTLDFKIGLYLLFTIFENIILNPEFSLLEESYYLKKWPLLVRQVDKTHLWYY